MTATDSIRSSHVTTSKGFHIRVYEPTPDGFDVRTATDRELVHYGLPRRPHRTHEHAAYEA